MINISDKDVKVMNDLDEVLKHVGVKGMKWGVRKNGRLTGASRKRAASYSKGMKFRDVRKLKKMTSAEVRSKYLDDKDKEWVSNSKNDANIHKVSKGVAKDMKRVNKQLKEKYGSDFKRAFNKDSSALFNSEYREAYKQIVADHTFAVYKMSPTRLREVKLVTTGDGALKATVVERSNAKLYKQVSSIKKATDKLAKREASIKHSDKSVEESKINGMFFIITMDEDGFPEDVIPPFDDTMEHGGVKTMKELDDVLQHWGVKGMKWDKEKKKDEDDIDKIKKAASKVVSSRIKKVTKNLKRDIAFVKKNPKQAIKNVTGVTKKEAANRAGFERTVRKLDPEAARFNDKVKSEIRKNKGLTISEQFERNNGKSVDNIKRDRERNKEAQKRAIRELPKTIKKKAIQKAKDKLGITKQESQERRQKTVSSKLDKRDTKPRNIQRVAAPQPKPKAKSRSTVRKRSNYDDLMNIKFDTNTSNKRQTKRNSRTLPR